MVFPLGTERTLVCRMPGQGAGPPKSISCGVLRQNVPVKWKRSLSPQKRTLVHRRRRPPEIISASRADRRRRPPEIISASHADRRRCSLGRKVYFAAAAETYSRVHTLLCAAQDFYLFDMYGKKIVRFNFARECSHIVSRDVIRKRSITSLFIYF